MMISTDGGSSVVYVGINLDELPEQQAEETANLCEVYIVVKSRQIYPWFHFFNINMYDPTKET